MTIEMKKKQTILLIICLSFYLLFPFIDGPVWCVDSASYFFMNITREPLYPTFLAFARGLSSLLQMDALMTAVILQSLLAGFTTWYAGLVVMRMKNYNMVLQLVTISFQFVVSLLCRFIAIRGSVYTDCIMTEGLSLSLFVLFILELYLYVDTENKKHFRWTVVLSFLLISLRKQMMITLLILCVVFLWRYLICCRQVQKLLRLLVIATCVVPASKLADRAYNYVVREQWIEHSGNAMGVLCTLLYTSDQEKDAALFQNEELKTLYLRMMELADKEQLLYDYAEPGWLSVASHYADSYDEIGYGIVNPVVEGYVQEGFDLSEVEAILKYDEICKGMTQVLMRQGRTPLALVYACNTWKGMVNSVAKANRILSLYALAAYLGMGAAIWYLMIQRKRMRQRELQNHTDEYRIPIMQIERSLSFAYIVLIGIVVNSLIVGLMIFAQPRYMIYSMGLFYTAGCMLLYDIWNSNRILRSKH